MRITENIYMVGSSNFGLSHGFDCNTYLIDLEDELVMIDAGSGAETERIVNNILRDNLDPKKISKIFLTHSHADHAGGAYYFYKNYNCKIYISEAEADFLEKGTEKEIALDIAKNSGLYSKEYIYNNCPVFKKLAGGDKISAGKFEINATSTPGHSKGSICFSIKMPEGDALFSGDTLLPGGIICVLNCEGSSLSDYRKYLKNLSEVNIGMLFPGHNYFVLNDEGQSLKIALKNLESLYVPKNFM